jgi:hypothetical protein
VTKYVNLSTLGAGETADPNQATADLVVVGGDFAGGAAAGDTMTGAAPTIADAAVPFADLTAAATAYNTLLAALRDRGVLASA